MGKNISDRGKVSGRALRQESVHRTARRLAWLEKGGAEVEPNKMIPET